MEFMYKLISVVQMCFPFPLVTESSGTRVSGENEGLCIFLVTIAEFPLCIQQKHVSQRFASSNHKTPIKQSQKMGLKDVT